MNGTRCQAFLLFTRHKYMIYIYMYINIEGIGPNNLLLLHLSPLPLVVVALLSAMDQWSHSI